LRPRREHRNQRLHDLPQLIRHQPQRQRIDHARDNVPPASPVTRGAPAILQLHMRHASSVAPWPAARLACQSPIRDRSDR
jgi:hypothetical protein